MINTFSARGVTIALLALLMSVPFVAAAKPFGGQITKIVYPCYNRVIWARLSAPVPGDYIWTSATRTYQFGPPTHVGQWLLGLTGVPYNCLVSINPIIVWEGITISMMGSSGPSGAAYPGPQYTPPSPGPSPSPSPSPSPKPPVKPPAGLPPSAPSSPSLGHLVISEVYYDVDSGHGTDPQNEWVELYNGSTVGVDVSGWTIADGQASRTIPQSVSIPPNGFLVLVADIATKTKWNIPSGVPVVTLGALIGDGLASAGDRLVLKNTNNSTVDSLSWGSNTTIFDPSLAPVARGHSLGRGTLTRDTHSASDWIDITSPTPGR